ncbi:hypothetical protein L7F22_054747 [Adiantum nelumboides]|nr:hypothetical protein [Adiantum nelumboides]
MTMEEARKIRLEKAKAIQKERRRIEAEQKAQEEAKAAQAAQTQEREVIDLSGTVEYLKKLEREEQRAAQLAREKIKEALSRKAEEPVLEPTQGCPKRPWQEEEEEIEHIQANPIPPSPINIPPAPPSSPITPFPPASTPQTPLSPLPLETPKSPPTPTSPQQQHFFAESSNIPASLTEEIAQPMETQTALQKETIQPMEKLEETKQTDGEQQQPREVDVSILIVQEKEPSSQEAIQEVKSFDDTKLIQTLSRQSNASKWTALELVTKERDSSARENENLLRDLIDLQSQLTRKEAQNHELIKNKKKMKEQIKYENAQFQKLNASYNTIKNTLTTLLQNQEPATAAHSTSNSAAINTLAALQEDLQTEKLQRQLLVSGFMSQTAQHEAKPPQVPELPEFQGIEEEEHLRPAQGALDIGEQMEQEIRDMPEGPAKEYLMYEKKVMESTALAFLQTEEQVKDFGSDFLPLSLMRHEATFWKEKMRMIVTCIQVFRDTEDDDHPWNLFLEGKRGICWNLRNSPPRWIIMALYSGLMYLPSHFLQTFKEAFITRFFKISTQIFHPMAKDLKARYVAYQNTLAENPFRHQQEDIAFATRKRSFLAQVAALEPQRKSQQ